MAHWEISCDSCGFRKRAVGRSIVDRLMRHHEAGSEGHTTLAVEVPTVRDGWDFHKWVFGKRRALSGR